jgi:hypothetical protein
MTSSQSGPHGLIQADARRTFPKVFEGFKPSARQAIQTGWPILNVQLVGGLGLQTGTAASLLKQISLP